MIRSARFDLSLNRDVAIKYPKKKFGESQRDQNKFIFEVVVTGQLDHPNIVPIYDFARDSAVVSLR